MNNNGQHSRRVEAVARRLHDPGKELTIADVSQAISELEAKPNRTHVLGMPRERLDALVVAETIRLEKLLGER